MITIITGTPGAGKTLYTIEKLLLPLVGSKTIGKDSQGNNVEIPRVIYTNINGLQVEHELIDGGDNQGLRDWHKWAKPGSVIVFDEFQKVWAPRANGSKVPDDIQALDTHRHMGVDFILITQSVINTDRHIHALAGRHLHVRRVGNMAAAVVYEWDHVSRALMYSKAIAKSPWRYSKKVFDLYKSAEIHTKQPRKIPGLIWFILFGLVALAFLAPTTIARLNDRATGSSSKPLDAPVKPALAPASAPVPGATPAPVAVSASAAPDERIDFIPRISDKPWTAPAYDNLRQVVNMPVISGGICSNGRCICVTNNGIKLEVSNNACSEWIENPPFNPYIANNVVRGGVVLADKQSLEGQKVVAPSSFSISPIYSGSSNPRADERPELIFPPGSSIHPELKLGET